MDWLKFFELITNSYIQLIHYTIWPLTVVVLILIFRKAILRSLGPLKKMSIGDKLALEFLPPELQKKIAEKVDFEEVTKDSLTWEHYLDALEGWMGGAALFAVSRVQLRLEGRSEKSDQEFLKDAVHAFNRMAKKIEKERSKSETLKAASEVIDDAKKTLKSYESSRPKPHWSDDL